ncbi:chlorophyll a/b-binding protein [Nostoc parmelioides]|uniref:High light inducible protein n=1 Tax=Nostoc parmelioides FACHB-3921 TaxID=2692909 RepID=A0ABR8BA79_9NOSO|nr:high light inducible protein [Nostoc parmelioides FACHB-3921]
MSHTTKGTQLIASKRNASFMGFNHQSESWNGRLAMIGFLAAIAIEFFSGQGFLHFWNIL